MRPNCRLIEMRCTNELYIIDKNAASASNTPTTTLSRCTKWIKSVPTYVTSNLLIKYFIWVLYFCRAELHCMWSKSKREQENEPLPENVWASSAYILHVREQQKNKKRQLQRTWIPPKSPEFSNLSYKNTRKKRPKSAFLPFFYKRQEPNFYCNNVLVSFMYLFCTILSHFLHF
jgi:hypothetical protein